MNSVSAGTRTPKSGPVIISIPGISDVQVGAGLSGAQVRYRWPADMTLEGIDFTTRAGTPAELAGTSLRIVDGGQSEVIFDGNGLANAVPGLALRGIVNGIQRTFFGRAIAFQRMIRAGDLWVFQIVNNNGVAVIPFLGFRIGQPIGGKARRW